MATEFEVEANSDSTENNPLEYNYRYDEVEGELNADEGEDIVKLPSLVVLPRSIKFFPLRTNRRSSAYKQQYHSLPAFHNILRTYAINSNSNRDLTLHTRINQRLHELDAVNNVRYKTHTSINGFKNYTSTNYDRKTNYQQNKLEQVQTVRAEKRKNFPLQSKLHRHQSRSIIESANQQIGEQILGPKGGRISFDRVDVSWIEPSGALTVVLVVSLFGICLIGVAIFFWLKNIFHQSSKWQTFDELDCQYEGDSHDINITCENQVLRKLQVMDHDSKIFEDCEKSNDKTDTDSDTADAKLSNNPVGDELYSSFDNLLLKRSNKTDITLVDKKPSPILIDTQSDNQTSNFIFSPAISSSLAATLTVPVPVPVPTNHQIFSQHKFYAEKQQDDKHITKNTVETVLPKTSSTTSTTAQSSHSTVISSNRFRRFSLCEKRPNSPQTNGPPTHYQKSQSVLKGQEYRRSCDDINITENQSRLSNNYINTQMQCTDRTSEHSSSTTNQFVCRSNGGGAKGVHNRVENKENAIPASGSKFSPKMKHTEQILTQQNSPRNVESPPISTSTRFTFSPKQLINNNENNNTVLQTFFATNVQSSPLLSSAVYKHGNYFKFPEVDCLTPDKTAKTEQNQIIQLSDKTDNIILLNESECSSNLDNVDIHSIKSKVKMDLPFPSNQATRRARLKSISLDSDGARLVEDNLGIPVEELIDINNLSTAMDEDSSVFDDTKTNQNYFIANSSNDNANAEQHDNRNLNLTCDTVDGGGVKFNSKNKNHLTINIDFESQFQDESQMDLEDHKITPKTPTFTQTKKKAISLDSSDSNIIYSLPSSCSVSTQQQSKFSKMNTESLLNVSSISVPTTPRRQQQSHHSNSNNSTGRKLHSNKNTKCRLGNTSAKMSLNKSSIAAGLPSTDHENSHKYSGFPSNLKNLNERSTPGDNNYQDKDSFYFNVELDTIGKKTGFLKNRDSSSDFEDAIGKPFIGNSSNLLGANLQSQKCTPLSLSNNNLKTLPEVMTISDFSTSSDNCPADDKKALKSNSSATIGVSKTSRNTILQRRGSNHSLTLNLNGSLGNLTKSLSASNYSLASTNLQASQYNLSGSTHNLNHQLVNPTAAVTPSGPNQRYAHQNYPISRNSSISGNSTAMTNSKKNLLQRRGSNTSLTLNIKGSSCMNLNRFNSHSSLNISNMQLQHHQPHSFYMQNQANQAGTNAVSSTKKGLLERRNSNASLTLNIQNRGFSVSNCNLRSSVCSLSSINSNPMDFDNNLASEQPIEPEPQQKYDLSYAATKHRKFFSSENLNSISKCSKLNQTHVRNSTKTCFGSVSDLKPNNSQQHQLLQSEQNVGDESKFFFSNIESDSGSVLDNFEQSNLCSCTGVRNITTKPLSPQSTSEDFKIYLANIQVLQNATNILNSEHLRKLNYVFEKSYNIEKEFSAPNDSKLSVAEDDLKGDIIDITINFEAPKDEEQKLLLRNLHQEFWDLPTNYQEKPLVFGSQAKNRYKTILPNEHSRVILDCEFGSSQEPYINANYIKGPDYTQNSYIATQGPLANTMYEFWLMIYQNIMKLKSTMKQSSNEEATIHQQNTKIEMMEPCKNAFAAGFRNNTRISNNSNREGISGNFNQKIVMLTNFVENNRQKCSIYFPKDEGKVIIITNTNEKIDSGDLIKFYQNNLIQFADNTPNNVDIDDTHVELKIDNEHLFDQIPKTNFFIIQNCGIVTKTGFTIRKFVCFYNQYDQSNNATDRDEKIFYQILQKFICYHYWFPDWPDHRSPNDLDALLDLSLHILDGRCETEFDESATDPSDIINIQNVDNQPLLVIHCSAGIGRTGCLAAILNGLQQMRSSWIQESAGDADNDDDENKYSQKHISVDILGIVCNLRLQRGGMVQNSEQYELIHRALCLYLNRIDLEKLEGIAADENNVATN